MLPSVVLALALTQFDQRFALTWNVPCAPAPDVPALVGTAEGEAVVTITPVDAQWHLEVVFVTPQAGTRKLDAPTCEDAARAALLFLKLGATARPDRAPVLVKPPEPEPPLPPPAPPTPAVRTIRIGVEVIGNVGALPSPTPRIGVTLGLSSDALAGFLTLRTGFDTGFATSPSLSVHPALGGQLSGCFLPLLGRFYLGACGVVVVEWWRIAGQGVDLPRAASEAWVAAGVDGRALLNLTRRLSLYAVVGPRFSLRRPQLIFEGLGEAFVAPIVSGEGAIGLGWQW